MRVIDVASEINDFGDTAAAMECLDLIISVDTAAGTLLGRWAPVWTLPTRRRLAWLIDREDSPWYPTMLFRQTELGNWSSPVARQRR
jgi:hypothetical protein